MRVSVKAIVLQSIKHGDHRFITKLYTRDQGLVTCAVRVSRAAGAKVRSATIRPLNFVEAELLIKQNKEISQLTEATCYYGAEGISASLKKLSIAQFLNEVMIKSLKEQGPNHHLFEFLENVIRFLSEADEDYINLPLYFLKELSKYLGFEPRNNYCAEEPYFDCREGRFAAQALVQPLGLSQRDSVLFSEFLKDTGLKTKLPYEHRQILLESFISYYRLHIPGFNELKSVEVLKITATS